MTRMKIIGVIILTLSLLTVGSVEAAPASTIHVTTNTISQRNSLITNTNWQRVHFGRRSLIVDYRLNLAAQNHANWISINGASHTGAGGSNGGQRITATGFTWTSWGENIAAGQSSVSTVIYAWMGSPSHRVNMLNPVFTRVGAGVVYRNGVWFWVIEFASK